MSGTGIRWDGRRAFIGRVFVGAVWHEDYDAEYGVGWHAGYAIDECDTHEVATSAGSVFPSEQVAKTALVSVLEDALTPTTTQ